VIAVWGKHLQLFRGNFFLFIKGKEDKYQNYYKDCCYQVFHRSILYKGLRIGKRGKKRYFRAMSVLYVVGTPIGNMKDITFRAIEVLKEVDVVACEDTRQTRKLLEHYGIEKRTISCRARNEENSAKGIIKLMEEGLSLAYLTDAGTPGVSDPGAVLVRHVREAGFAVYPIPGPSAFASLVSVGGFSGKTVLFEGFLPQKPGKRKKRLTQLLEREESFLLYESPFRIIKLLTELSEIEGDREIMIGREMTKTYEEYKSGTPKELIFLLERENSVKGEFSVLVSGRKKT